MSPNIRKYTFGHVTSKCSNQPAHLHSLIRIFTECILNSKGCSFNKWTTKTDQQGWE